MADSTQRSILILEDDPFMGDIIHQLLLARNYDVILCDNAEKAFSALENKSFDLLILDVVMPGKDGFMFATEFRQTDELTPIVFLTSNASKEDKIKGFKLGGDDYITKPFNVEELELRVAAILKRTTLQKIKGADPKQTEFSIGKYHFDAVRQELRMKEHTQQLSSIESKLLRMLVEHLNDEIKRSDALISIWGEEDYYKTKSMNVYITRLRKFLAEDSRITIISLRGEGYKLLFRED